MVVVKADMCSHEDEPFAIHPAPYLVVKPGNWERRITAVSNGC